MTDRHLPLALQISLTKEGLKSLSIAKAQIERRMMLTERGINEMYDSEAKTCAWERYSELEVDLENVKEKIKANEDWLVDVGAKGWGIKI